MASLERLHVLVVDDNPHMRTIVVTILRGAGFGDVREASDGSHAMVEMSSGTIDIVIVDLNMTPVDGLDFTRMVRTSPECPSPFLPIIMMTGHTERSKVTAARDAGINELVAKPISAKTLLARIVSVIDRPRSFVRTKSYTGPCRRRGRAKDFAGPWLRKSDDENQDKAAQGVNSNKA